MQLKYDNLDRTFLIAMYRACFPCSLFFLLYVCRTKKRCLSFYFCSKHHKPDCADTSSHPFLCSPAHFVISFQEQFFPSSFRLSGLLFFLFYDLPFSVSSPSPFSLHSSFSFSLSLSPNPHNHTLFIPHTRFIFTLTSNKLQPLYL